MAGYRHVKNPTLVPVPGGKVIEEIFGRVNTGTDQFSLARMVAPPGWSEPPQTPDFGELTIMIRGSMNVEVGGEDLEIRAGESLWTEAGVRVHYRNESGEESEYYAICIPAFSPELAHRDEG